MSAGVERKLAADSPADAGGRRPERGQELELEIEGLAHGGEGVARYGDVPAESSGASSPVEGGSGHGGGYVVFVSGAVPGDKVRAEVVKRKRSYAHARCTEVLRPSPERIPPTADHPGVAWQVLPYERQLQVKAEQVDDALRRIGRLDGYELEPIVPALQEWRYRNKLEYSFGEASGEATGAAGAAGAAGPPFEDAPTLADEQGGMGGEGFENGVTRARAREEGFLNARARGLLVCGFHAPGGWKRVEPIEDCLLASELGNRAREVALEWARRQGLHAWDRRRESLECESHAPEPLLRNLVVREGRRTGKLQVRLVSTAGDSKRTSRPGSRARELDVPSLAAALVAELGEDVVSGVLWTRSAALAETTMGGETELVWGEAELPERLRVRAPKEPGAGRPPTAASNAEDADGGLDLRISPEAFFQTNTEMAEVLYGVAAEYAALQGWERVYDLYCGIGTIALTLAPRAGEVWGIELVEQAVADAIAGAKRNDVANARFFAGDTRLALPELVQRAGKPDVVVVDPPRAGLSGKVVRRIAEAMPKRIVYVSCNPTTLAPNAAQLVQEGWRLVKVRPVDMFPQTPHIECVAVLER